MRILRFFALYFLLALPLHAQTRILDRVDFSDHSSRTAHRAVWSNGELRNERALVGTLSLPVSGVQLAPGGSVRARLRAEGPFPVSFLVTLATSPRDYRKRQVYHVSVDQKELYRSTEVDPGGGVTQSFFVDVPTTHGPTIEVEVAADPVSNCPITVSSIRVYESDPSKPFIASQRAKLAITLVSRQEGGYKIDDDEQRALNQIIPKSPFIVPQTAVLYNFCIRNAQENAQEIQRLAGIADRTGIPMRIAFQVHWGGSPKGVSDGAGGTFTDLPYQQICYDRGDKTEDSGLAALMGDRYDVRYGLSVPNVWNDAPWLTFNHPRLNQFRRIRLTQALTAWRQIRDRFAAVGKGRLLPMELSTGDETVYWAKGVDDSKYAAQNGKPRSNLMADFNPFTVAEALDRGIILDPKSGLDHNATWWLHQNLAKQQQRLIQWMFDALPADPVKLDPSPVYAFDLIRRNLFSEPYAMPMYPMKDVNPSHPGLELGFVREGRSGGEYWNGSAMLPWLLKARERGRMALPNLECTGAQNDAEIVSALRAAYACGARFATLYNWQKRPRIHDILNEFESSILNPSDVDYSPTAGKSGDAFSRKVTREFEASAGAFGINRLELFPTAPLAKPVPIRITLIEADRTVPHSLSLVASLENRLEESSGELEGARSRGCQPIFLPTFYSIQPGRKYVVSIEPIGGLLPELLVSKDGLPAMRISADILHERRRSIAIQDWQDAADAIESVASIHAHSPESSYAIAALENARTLLETNKPQEAYRAAIKAEQLSLPAGFVAPAGGARLAPYLIAIACPVAPVEATINAYAEATASVTLKSEVAQKVGVTWGAFNTTAELSPGVPAEITLELGPKPPIQRRTIKRKLRVIRRRSAIIKKPAPKPFGPPLPRRSPSASP